MRNDFQREKLGNLNWGWRATAVIGVVGAFAMGLSHNNHQTASRADIQHSKPSTLNIPFPKKELIPELPGVTHISPHYLDCDTLDGPITETVDIDKAVVLWTPSKKNASHVLHFAFSEPIKDQFYIDYLSGSENQLVDRKELIDHPDGLFVTAAIDGQRNISMRLHIDTAANAITEKTVRLDISCMSPQQVENQHVSYPNPALGNIVAGPPSANTQSLQP